MFGKSAQLRHRFGKLGGRQARLLWLAPQPGRETLSLCNPPLELLRKLWHIGTHLDRGHQRLDPAVESTKLSFQLGDSRTGDCPALR
jgi:hypothetical protein